MKEQTTRDQWETGNWQTTAQTIRIRVHVAANGTRLNRLDTVVYKVWQKELRKDRKNWLYMVKNGTYTNPVEL